MATSLWNFAPNSKLRKFFFGMSIVKMYYRFSSTRWTLRT